MKNILLQKQMYEQAYTCKVKEKVECVCRVVCCVQEPARQCSDYAKFQSSFYFLIPSALLVFFSEYIEEKYELTQLNVSSLQSDPYSQ